MSAAMTRALPVIYICILAGMVTTSFALRFPWLPQWIRFNRLRPFRIRLLKIWLQR
jgi:hypothetical protein